VLWAVSGPIVDVEVRCIINVRGEWSNAANHR
jgi:hypothetical protein